MRPPRAPAGDPSGRLPPIRSRKCAVARARIRFRWARRSKNDGASCHLGAVWRNRLSCRDQQRAQRLRLVRLLLCLRSTRIRARAVPKNQDAVEAQALERGARKKCPSCAELVRVEATRCRFCGDRLDGVNGPRPDSTDDTDVRRLIAELRRPASPGEPSVSRQDLIEKLRSGRGPQGTA